MTPSRQPHFTPRALHTISTKMKLVVATLAVFYVGTRESLGNTIDFAAFMAIMCYLALFVKIALMTIFFICAAILAVLEWKHGVKATVKPCKTDPFKPPKVKVRKVTMRHRRR